MKDQIFVKGAKEHNLKNIDVHIPRNELVVITGLSGSGKSSLAFDTIYAEGQRRYVESLSAYARQFLGQMEKPDVEFIEGLSPAISIDQKSTSKNPRSTVGTITEIYDYLRLLYARVGIPHCPVCGIEISPANLDEVVDQVMELEEGTRIYVLAPVVRGKKGTHAKIFEALRKDGFARVKVNGELKDLQESIELEKNKKHDISVVVDRLVIKQDIVSRLTDSIETALELEDNMVVIEVLGQGERVFNMNFSCPEHGQGINEMEPRSFSFNAPFGACEKCKGLGFLQELDPELIIPDRSLSIDKGAILAMKNVKAGTYHGTLIRNLLKGTGFDTKTPIEEFSEEALNRLFWGEAGKQIDIEYESSRYGRRVVKTKLEGIMQNLQRRYHETRSGYMRDEIENYMAEIPCSSCGGKRLKPEVLAVTIGGLNIVELTTMSVGDIRDFFTGLILEEPRASIAAQIIKEIKARLDFLIDVGLDYLTLARRAGSLSGGESQRIRLATQIGSGLTGVLYILDEPSIGLHQRDNKRLLGTLRNLTNLGNTLIIVEHDEETIEAADYILDIGPGAGEHGGHVVAEGPIEDIVKVEESITGQFISGKRRIEVPSERRKPSGHIRIKGAQVNNLKNIDVDFPLGVFTCVTGVSGSGKSSLVNEIFYKAMHRNVYRNLSIKPGPYKSIEGWQQINKVIAIDQSPIGRTPRSNPATYTKVFDPIRDLFSELPESKKRGYAKGRFSFNVKGGRCEACKGDGINKIEMHFLPDIYVKCETCKGKRYNRETLEVKYKDKSIYDILEMTVSEALVFFENHTMIKRRLQTLQDVGLGYIKLGQPSTQLSGGEAQRVKLASELSKRDTGQTLYILDEPTTGLHMADVELLIRVLQRLVDGGNSLIVIEHNLDVIKSADHIIDLGPEGGHRGGELVAVGSPEDVAKIQGSYTGQFLKDILSV